MLVFICSFSRCFNSPWRDISQGMSSGCRIFLRLASLAGACIALSSRLCYSFWCALPRIQAFASPPAMYQSLLDNAMQAPARNAKRRKILHPEDMPWEMARQGLLKHLLNEQMNTRME